MSETNAPAVPAAPADAKSASAWSISWMLLAAGAIYIGLWVAVGAAFRTNPSFAKPPAEVWRSMVAAQGVLWAALLWLNAPDLVATFRRGRPAAVYLSVIFIAVTASGAAKEVFPWFVFGYPEHALMGSTLQAFVTTFITLGCVTTAAIATIVGVATGDLCTQNQTFESLVRHRNQIKKAGTSLTVALIVAVTSTSWLAKSLEAVKAGAFPNEFVLTYGLYFTALLVAVYLPASVAFYRAAMGWVDEKYKMETFDKDRAEVREAALKELGLTTGDAVQSALATLAPVVASVLSVALGKD